MDCPKFTNSITVTHNEGLEEVVINFFHEFPIVENSAEENDDEVAKATAGSEYLGGVVLSDKTAIRLYDLLGTLLGKEKSNE